MFKVTYINLVNGKALQTITHPVEQVAEQIARALQGQGFKVRFWAKDGSLIF